MIKSLLFLDEIPFYVIKSRNKAIVRGDVDHKPHSLDCRERALEWLKRQEDHRIQARLTSAQMRQEAKRTEEDGVNDTRRKIEGEPRPNLSKEPQGVYSPVKVH